MDHFAEAISRTLKWEGGYVDHPDDPGGETNFGISKRSYPYLDIRNLTEEEAREIYRRDYWEKAGIWRIADRELACKMFDLAVNLGPWRAVRRLQRAAMHLGGILADDGKLGPETARVVNAMPHPDALLCCLKVMAGMHYLSLNKTQFLAGWLRRLDS